MRHPRPVAVHPRREYPYCVRKLLQLFLLLSVALLPLTSFAARAGSPADLTSSAAVELEQGTLPTSGQRAAPAQEHRHCTHWAAEAGACLALANNLSATFLVNPRGLDAPVGKLAGPEVSTPPPKA